MIFALQNNWTPDVSSGSRAPFQRSQHRVRFYLHRCRSGAQLQTGEKAKQAQLLRLRIRTSFPAMPGGLWETDSQQKLVEC